MTPPFNGLRRLHCPQKQVSVTVPGTFWKEMFCANYFVVGAVLKKVIHDFYSGPYACMWTITRGCPWPRTWKGGVSARQPGAVRDPPPYPTPPQIEKANERPEQGEGLILQQGHIGNTAGGMKWDHASCWHRNYSQDWSGGEMCPKEQVKEEEGRGWPSPPRAAMAWMSPLSPHLIQPVPGP